MTKLNSEEISALLQEDDDEISESGTDFSDGSDDIYSPSSGKSIATDDSASDAEDSQLSDKGSSVSNDSIDDQPMRAEAVNDEPLATFVWSTPDESFIPRKSVTSHRECKIAENIARHSTPYEIFRKLFPRSISLYIAQCTNERLRKVPLSGQSRKKLLQTDSGEIDIILGCMFIMSYNHMPSIKDYWSNHYSLSNESIKSAISRDRFEQIMSKLYFAPVEKPADAGKTYYIDDFINCLKKTFKVCRDDSSFQSIDEQTTKFKGRSSLKQYMPLKPVKRGIKMWLRCDSLSGYTYDMNIYSGKEGSGLEGTLGERVVNDLAGTISNPNVTLCFDRFFTSVHLINNIQYPALGTCMSNRKNVPKMPEKLQRGESIFKVNSAGTIAVKWQDVKEVMLLSNCHTPEMSTVKRKMKDGTEGEFPCPEIVKTYRAIMGGVDLADQMSGLYDINRKSNKWWKKVFYRGMMMAAVNTWVIHSELNRWKRPFQAVLVEIAESLIEKGKESTVYKRSRRCGRSSNMYKSMRNVGDHLPIEESNRRRCVSCAKRKVEKRTKIVCRACKLPFCINCFASAHS